MKKLYCLPSRLLACLLCSVVCVGLCTAPARADDVSDLWDIVTGYQVPGSLGAVSVASEGDSEAILGTVNELELMPADVETSGGLPFGADSVAFNWFNTADILSIHYDAWDPVSSNTFNHNVAPNVGSYIDGVGVAKFWQVSAVLNLLENQKIDLRYFTSAGPSDFGYVVDFVSSSPLLTDGGSVDLPSSDGYAALVFAMDTLVSLPNPVQYDLKSVSCSFQLQSGNTWKTVAVPVVTLSDDGESFSYGSDSVDIPAGGYSRVRFWFRFADASGNYPPDFPPIDITRSLSAPSSLSGTFPLLTVQGAFSVGYGGAVTPVDPPEPEDPNTPIIGGILGVLQEIWKVISDLPGFIIHIFIPSGEDFTAMIQRVYDRFSEGGNFLTRLISSLLSAFESFVAHFTDWEYSTPSFSYDGLTVDIVGQSVQLFPAFDIADVLPALESVMAYVRPVIVLFLSLLAFLGVYRMSVGMVSIWADCIQRKMTLGEFVKVYVNYLLSPFVSAIK